jgi:PhnB protein
MSIDTYLSFDGTCREALDFYAGLLGGRVIAMTRFGDVPGSCEDGGPGVAERIMHGCLELDGRRLMGTDSTPAHPYRGVQGAHVVANVADAAEAERIFPALAHGGRIDMPLQETFWATRYGICVDRFGVPWMVNCARPQPAQVAA